MAARATHPGTMDAPTVAVRDGRHARGTWTPRVTPGSGGRRYLREQPAAIGEPATAVVTAAPGEPGGAGRAPIRYAPVPGTPRRWSPAVWGPPLPLRA